VNEIIGAQHEFHDAAFVAGWADRFAPTPERLKLFNVILSELKSRIPQVSCVVELGIGPGYLADHLDSIFWCRLFRPDARHCAAKAETAFIPNCLRAS